MSKNLIVLYSDGKLNIDVEINVEHQTLWVTQKQMEELFDVLNEKGEYTGKIETREKCHKDGLWHKAVVVFIINSKGQVLLQRRR